MKLAQWAKQVPSQSQQILIYSFIVLILSALWFVYSVYFQPLFFPFDDSYIALHNAQVLHLGYDLNYPGVSALYGTTSAVHLAELFLWLFWLPPATALLTTQWLAIIAYAIALLNLIFLYRVTWIQGLMFFVAGLTIAYVPFQLLNGLETGLAMAAMTWLLWMASLPAISSVRRYWLPFLGGIFAFIRPEIGIFVLLLIFWQNIKNWRGLSQQSLLLLAGALPWLLWYWLATGYPMPQTMAAKIAFYGEIFWPLGLRVQWTLINMGAMALVLGFYLGFVGMLILLLTSSLGRIGFLFIVIFLTLYTFFIPDLLGPGFNVGRYWYPCIPILFYGLLSNLHHSDLTIRKGANFLLFLVFCQALLFLPAHWKFYLDELQKKFVEYDGTAKWCVNHLPANSMLLIHDAGYLAYKTPFHLVDMVGLKTPENIHYHQKITIPTRGDGRVTAIAEIINYYHPKFLVVLRSWDVSMTITSGLRHLGWQLTPLRESKTFGDYSIYQLSDPSSHLKTG